MPDVTDYTTPNTPTWCPGCGNHGMWEALKRALSELEMDFDEFSSCGASAATATAPTSSRLRASTRCTDARCLSPRPCDSLVRTSR